MSNAQHTPGPWVATRNNDATGVDVDPYYIFIEPGVAVVEVAAEDCLLEQDWANARLIAAAPELLEALDCLIDWVQPDGSFPDNATVRSAIKDARAAIAKATGA